MKLVIKIGRTRAGFRHGLVNMVTGVVGILDNLVLITSFGQISSNLTMVWIFYSIKFKKRKQL